MPKPPDTVQTLLEPAAGFLRNPGDLMITSHVNSDGDGIAGGLALANLARQLGSRPAIILQDPPSVDYSYLVGWDELIEAGAEAEGQFERVAVLDCPSLDRIGEARAHLTDDVSLLNIDHHRDNEGFGSVNLAAGGVCSTCEMIYHLAVYMDMEIDRDTAEQLYTGILYDTGCFRYSLTTATSLEVGADLVRRGARLDLIADRLFNSDTFGNVKIVGKAIDSLELHCDERLATMVLRHADIQQGDPDATVNYGLRVRGVAVSILLKEERIGHYRISLRSREAVDVAEVARGFGGGGHARAAGCRIDGEAEEVMAQLVEAIGKVLP